MSPQFATDFLVDDRCRSTRFAGYLAGKAQIFGEKFDASDLNPNCITHYNAGHKRRIKVRWRDGLEQWGCLGITTGWRPTFLLMHNRRAIGSGNTLPNDGSFTIVDAKDLQS
jgi:hypothetical protein